MALYRDGMLCPICGSPITNAHMDSGDVFSTLFYDVANPTFAPLDDGIVHQNCLDTWPHRDAFVAFYNSNCRDELRVTRKGRVTYRPSRLSKLWWRITGG